MNYKEMIHQLSSKYPFEIMALNNTSDIMDLSFIDGFDTCDKKNILYFGYWDQYQKLAFPPSHALIAKNTSDSISHAGPSDLVLLPPELLFAAFNDVKSLLQFPGSGLFEELTAIADRTHSIDQIMDVAALRLNNSLIFCDMNFKIISNSTTIPVSDPLWIENIRQGYCSYAFIQEIRALKNVQNAPESTVALDVTCAKSSHRKYSSKVFHNKKQVGFLLLIDGEGPILPGHTEMLRTVSHVVSYAVSFYNANLFEETNSYSEFINELLIGAPTDTVKSSYRELTFPESMVAMSIEPTRYLGQKHLADFVSKHLKFIVHGAHGVFHQKSIVALIPLPADSAEQAANLAVLENCCIKEHFKFGVSNSFHHIEHFVTFAEQAARALELGKKINPDHIFYLYRDYQVFDLLSNIPTGMNPGRFCHPALGILREYDHQNNSELYKTLWIFIDNGCNIKHTSEKLFIHRNSLVYRLDRIEQNCRLDLSDPQTIFQLRLSFLIDRFNELSSDMEWKGL